MKLRKSPGKSEREVGSGRGGEKPRSLPERPACS